MTLEQIKRETTENDFYLDVLVSYNVQLVKAILSSDKLSDFEKNTIVFQYASENLSTHSVIDKLS